MLGSGGSTGDRSKRSSSGIVVRTATLSKITVEEKAQVCCTMQAESNVKTVAEGVEKERTKSYVSRAASTVGC